MRRLPCARYPSSIHIERSCSTNNGFPSAACAIRSLAVRVEPRVPDEVLDQQVRVRAREGTDGEDGGVGSPSAPPRPSLEDLHPRRADDKQRCVTQPVSDRLEQVEQGGLGPMDVLDDQDDRSLGRHPLEEPADRPRRFTLRERRVGDPEDLRQGVDDALPVLGLRQARDKFATHRRGIVAIEDPGDVPHDLRDRPVRDGVAVGEAPPDQDEGRAATRRANSSTRRVFPMPASPDTVTSRHARSLATRSKARSSSASSSARPTMGESIRRATPRAPARRSTDRRITAPPSPVGSTVTASRTSA